MAFGRDCSRITGQVTIRFTLATTLILQSAKSRMEDFLQTLGLGNVTEMTGDLVIENIAVNIDAPVFLQFFTELQRVRSLSITGTRNPPVSSISFIAGFPGLMKLQQAQQLSVIKTSLPDVDFLANLRCVGVMTFIDNVVLTSLQGMQDTRVGIPELRNGSEGNDLTLTGQTSLVGVDSLTPLAKVAGCQRGPRPPGSLYIEKTCQDVIDSWAALCGILQTLDCSARPPPPPPQGVPPPPGSAFPASVSSPANSPSGSLSRGTTH
jgi:hypothetical protein